MKAKTDKSLRKLSRKELLEILVNQSHRIEHLEAQLREANEKLQMREIVMDNAGSIAEAALRLNQIFQDADAACQQYLDSAKAAAARMAEREKTLLGEEGGP
jgi:chemotaxis regulatin CheY-phosphate phosphatase CheZ